MKYYGLLSFFLIFSCSDVKKIQKEKANLAFEAKVEQFKTVFFRSCISSEYAYRHDNSGDRSIASDFPLGIKNYKIIDSISTIVKNTMHQDSINWTNQICKVCNEDPELLQRHRENGMIGKKTLRFCLDYYKSEELDSIARTNLKM